MFFRSSPIAAVTGFLASVAIAAGCSGPGLSAGPSDAGADTSAHPGADASADANADASADAVASPDALAPPATGVQLKTDAFAVAAGAEVQNCYFFLVSDLEKAAGLPTDQSLWVNRVQTVETPGSHHMNVFRVRTIVNLDPTMGTVTGLNGAGQCFVSSNWADWPLLANTQQAGDQDWSYPTGVANELAPTEWLMLQTHYVNASTQTTPGGGQVAVNLWTIPADQVTAQIGTLFATDQNIRICQSNPTPTYQQGCQFKSTTPVTIIGANGHFHSRGTQFDMYTWDGTSTTTPPATDRFYQSTTWDDPPMAHATSLAQIPANGGIWYSCAYQWQAPPASVGCAAINAYDATKHMTPVAQQDCCYTFGPIVEKNEHCNAFVYYYPKQDNVVCM